LGYPVPEGNKYRNLALLIEGVSNETVRCGHEIYRTFPESDNEWYE
jgi:hypothetical protein